MRISNKLDKYQRGAALIVSLVILAVMTLLGVTAMSQSRLETLMAGNLQIQTSSLANAENALTQSENEISNITTDSSTFNFDDTNDGIYLYDRANPENNINPVMQIQSNAGFSTATDSANIPPERYIVEYLGPRIIPGESIIIGRQTPGAGSQVHLFRNTALSFNNDNGARRLVQSIFVTADAP